MCAKIFGIALLIFEIYIFYLITHSKHTMQTVDFKVGSVWEDPHSSVNTDKNLINNLFVIAHEYTHMHTLAHT